MDESCMCRRLSATDCSNLASGRTIRSRSVVLSVAEAIVALSTGLYSRTKRPSPTPRANLHTDAPGSPVNGDSGAGFKPNDNGNGHGGGKPAGAPAGAATAETAFRAALMSSIDAALA